MALPRTVRIGTIVCLLRHCCMRSNLLLACAIPLLVTACADLSNPTTRPFGRLTLNMPISVPADSATARLQFGRLVARNAVNEYEPFCVFELNTVEQRPQAVLPETFDIVRIERSIDLIAGIRPEIMPVSHVRNDGGQPSQLFYKTGLRLRARQQSSVRALTCMSNQMAAGIYPFMRHLTLAEMRGALGNVFTLELTDKSAGI